MSAVAQDVDLVALQANIDSKYFSSMFGLDRPSQGPRGLPSFFLIVALFTCVFYEMSRSISIRYHLQSSSLLFYSPHC